MVQLRRVLKVNKLTGMPSHVQCETGLVCKFMFTDLTGEFFDARV